MATVEVKCKTCDVVVGTITKPEVTSADINKLLDQTTCSNGHSNRPCDMLSPIQVINRDWQHAYSDYKAARVAMYTVMAMAGGFSELSADDKRIVSAWFIVGTDERDSTCSFEDQVADGKLFKRRSVAARTARLDEALLQVYNRLAHDEVNSILGDPNVIQMMDAYVKYGTEGTVEGDIEGLIDYILARDDTSFSVNGFAKKAFIPRGMQNMQELADNLYTILVNGG